LIKHWRNFPSDKSLGYFQALLPELEKPNLLTTDYKSLITDY
jgi:hypothetical protein